MAAVKPGMVDLDLLEQNKHLLHPSCPKLSLLSQPPTVAPSPQPQRSSRLRNRSSSGSRSRSRSGGRKSLNFQLPMVTSTIEYFPVDPASAVTCPITCPARESCPIPKPTEGGCKTKLKNIVYLLNFPPRNPSQLFHLMLGSHLPGGQSNPKSPLVGLETIGVKDEGGIIGTILVRNIAPEKKVFVRFTLDNWLTHTDQDTVYAASFNPAPDPRFPGLLGVDRFSFSIDLRKIFDQITLPRSLKRPDAFCADAGPMALNPERRRCMFMAIAYEALGGTHWDNNGDGSNFGFEFGKVNGEELNIAYESSSTVVFDLRTGHMCNDKGIAIDTGLLNEDW